MPENNIIDMTIFKDKIPDWGGKFIYNKTEIDLIDTCTIDYFLLAFWTSTRMNRKLFDSIGSLIFTKKQSIIDIINCIDKNAWNKAKSIWIIQILCMLKPNIKCKCKSKRDCQCFVITTYGTEYEFVLSHVIEIQSYNLILSCSNDCLSNNKVKQSISLNFEKKDDKVKLKFTNIEKCKICGTKIKLECKLRQDPLWIFVQTIQNEAIYANDLPKSIKIGDKIYQLLCATFHEDNPAHFTSVFYLNGSFVFVDDLNEKEYSTKIPKLPIVTSFYYLNLD